MTETVGDVDGIILSHDEYNKLLAQIKKMKCCINCKKCHSIDDICCGRVYLCSGSHSYDTDDDEQTYPECVCDKWELAE